VTAAEYLARVEARAERATNGPWTVEGDGDGGDWPEVVVSEIPRREITNVEGTTEAEVFGNCHFIAASRTDVPRLVRMLRVAMECLGHYSDAYENPAACAIDEIDAIANEGTL